jgi:hypothetical protein
MKLFFWRKKSYTVEEEVEKLLSNLKFKDWIVVRDLIEKKISSFSDGFFYECEIRSYGSVTKKNFTNSFTVQELCYSYNGDNGIVDVYTNNPKLDIKNYSGTVYYFPSQLEAEKWKNYVSNDKLVEQEFKKIKEWEESILPIHKKVMFPPSYTKDQLLEIRRKLDNEKQSIVFPIEL